MGVLDADVLAWVAEGETVTVGGSVVEDGTVPRWATAPLNGDMSYLAD